MAHFGGQPGYTVFANAEVEAFEQKCLLAAEEQVKKKYLHAIAERDTVIAERDTVIAKCDDYIKRLMEEKSNLVRKDAWIVAL